VRPNEGCAALQRRIRSTARRSIETVVKSRSGNDRDAADQLGRAQIAGRGVVSEGNGGDDAKKFEISRGSVGIGVAGGTVGNCIVDSICPHRLHYRYGVASNDAASVRRRHFGGGK
jgi:hypothetical protein